MSNYALHDIAKSKGLKIASLNINSLLKHLDEIRILLEKYTFDVLAINESKIDNSISNNEIHIYICYLPVATSVLESLLHHFNVYSSMAEKQLKRCDKNDFIFCTTDVCIPNTTMKR